ncbi:hypothetical protein D3C76_1554510 [compost metagenome]
MAEVGFPAVGTWLNYRVSGYRVKLCIAEIRVARLLDILEPVIVHETPRRLKVAEIRDFLAFEDTPNPAKQQ